MSRAFAVVSDEVSSCAFSTLLSRLDPDPNTAGHKYEQLRRSLIKIFDWRGISTSDMCADETIDRVARKLHAGVAIESVSSFAYGVARLVILEQRRKPEARQVVLDEAFGIAARSVEIEDDRCLSCLERCLDTLDRDARSLILRYYGGVRRERIDSRIALARELALTPSALRSRTQRIRDRLERCTTACERADARRQTQSPRRSPRDVVVALSKSDLSYVRR